MIKRSGLYKKVLLISIVMSFFCSAQSFQLADVINSHLNIAFNIVKNHPILGLASVIGLSTGLYVSAATAQKYRDSKLYWNWNTIDTSKLTFPKDMLLGVGSSAAQVENGSNNDTWSKKADEKRVENKQPTLKSLKQESLDAEWQDQKDLYIDHLQKQGKDISQEELEQHKKKYFTFSYTDNACEAEKYYKEDVQLLKNLGCTAYRFSVDWAKVMNENGTFNASPMIFYNNLCYELNKNGIKPVVTLYHYTEPIWFADKGGFEKKENIKYFVDFCSHVFETLGNKVHLYFAFNSPIGGFALSSYQQGSRPPFKKDMKIAAEVIKNVLDAHVAVYKAKKEINNNLQVGILKNIHQLEPARVWHPVDQLVCSIGNKIQDDPFYQFFTTGKINLYIPGFVSIKHENKDAPKSLDFIGLNYYGHRFMKGTQIEFNPREERCGTPGNYHPSYTIYAEGLYHALKTLDKKLVKPLEKNINRHIPIYVTENGIGTDDDEQRNKFMSRYLYALSKAIQDGIDIRGYFCWSFLDNYEWGQYSKHYGLFKVNRTTQERMLKPGASHYRNVMMTHGIASNDTKIKQNKNQYMVNDVTVTVKGSPEEII